MFPGLTNLKTNNQPAPVTTGIGKDNAFSGTPIAQQKLGGNSETQTMRSIQNWLASQGTSTYQQGADTTNTGLQGFSTAGDTTKTALGTTTAALGTTGTAMGTTDKALSSLSPAEDYWTKLLSGDKKTQLEAIAPAATQSGLNYANVLTGVNQNTARGGYSGVLAAGMPQAQAREVNSMLYSLAPTAATNLNTIANTKNSIAGTQGNVAGVQNNIAGTQGNIAGVQGQIAQWLSSLGIDISKLGLSGVQSANDSILNARGQDVAEHGQALNLAGSTAGSAAQLYGGVYATNAKP